MSWSITLDADLWPPHTHTTTHTCVHTCTHTSQKGKKGSSPSQFYFVGLVFVTCKLLYNFSVHCLSSTFLPNAHVLTWTWSLRPNRLPRPNWVSFAYEEVREREMMSSGKDTLFHAGAADISSNLWGAGGTWFCTELLPEECQTAGSIGQVGPLHTFWVLLEW